MNLDPLKVTITVGSKFLTGFAPDGIFSLVNSADRVSHTVGSQGDSCYIENADESAILTVTLMPNSPSNAYLEDLCNRRAFFNTTINDASDGGKMTKSSANCRVQKYADDGRSNTATTRSWNIIMTKVVKTG